VERDRYPDAEPHETLAGAAQICASADHADRLFAVLPFYLQWLIPIDLRVLRVLRLFRLLKLVRYSPALQTLGRVLAPEYRSLLGALLVMLVLLLFASTLIYLSIGASRCVRFRL
jgi:hypothetical protein